MVEICCTNCEGACCRVFTMIRLSAKEHDFMENSDAALVELDPRSPSLALVASEGTIEFIEATPPEEKTYVFVKDCPHLREEGGWAKCSIYNDPDRPRACGSFRVESQACKDAIGQWAIYREVRLQIGKKPKNNS